METLLQIYCFEIQVTCARPTEQDKSVQRMALYLVQYLAVFLAETITSLLQKVLTHPAGGLVDDTNAALPTQCENHVRELRTFFTVVLEPNIHTFSVLSETLQDFLKSKLC